MAGCIDRMIKADPKFGKSPVHAIISKCLILSPCFLGVASGSKLLSYIALVVIDR